MSRRSSGQTAAKILAEVTPPARLLSLRTEAGSAWGETVERNRATIAGLLRSVLSREPDERAIAPLKGRLVVVECEGLLFSAAKKDGHTTLTVVVACPVCDEPKDYYVTGYARLGEILANAAIDSRCGDCVRANRRVRRRWFR